jgi:hypothetical protein
MNEDLRCCGSGTCIIEIEGRCRRSQQCDGERLCRSASGSPSEASAPEPA